MASFTSQGEIKATVPRTGLYAEKGRVICVVQIGVPSPILMSSTQLTVHQTAQLEGKSYDELKTIVVRDRATVQQWIDALVIIRDKGLWKKEAGSWQDWCLQFAGMTADAIRVREYREREKLKKPHVPAVFKRAEKLLAEVAQGKLVETQPEILDNTLPIPVDVRVLIHTAAHELGKLLNDSVFALSEKFRHAANAVCKADKLLAPMLPGMEEFGPRQKSRGTMAEVQEFCLAVELTLQDAQWFFAKCQGAGWKVNGESIADWRGVVRAWKIQGNIFPSQKAKASNNGSLAPAEMMVRQKELDDCYKQMKSLRDSYTDNMSWSKPDAARYRTLQGRRDELKKILGIQV